MSNTKVFQSLLFVALWLLLGAAAWPMAIDAGSATQVTIHITDFGINQGNGKSVLGGDLMSASNRVFPDYTPAAQIAVPMPTDQELKTLSQEELTGKIRDAVASRVKEGLRNGVTRFEVQLIQNIDTEEYFQASRQRAVNEFGAAAYRAIGLTIEELRAGRLNVKAYAIAGSNGTAVLTANLESLKFHGRVYLDGIDLFDGRAFFVPTQRLIEAVGPEKVRIFNTRRDWPAPYTPIGFRSIGSFDTVIDLKDRYPQLRTYLLRPLAGGIGLGSGHVTGMTMPDSQFSVQEYLGNGYMRAYPTVRVRGRNLRRVDVGGRGVSALDVLLASGADGSVTVPTVRELIRVHAAKAEELAAGIFAYAGVLSVAHDQALSAQRDHERALRSLPFLRNTRLSKREMAFLKTGAYVKKAYGVSDALRRDLEENRFGNFSFLSSHTLSALGEFGLDTLIFLKLDESLRLSPLVQGALQRIDGYREILTGAAKHVGQGHADVNVVTHYLDGIKALAAVSLATRKQLTGQFAYLDGLQELGTTAYKHARGQLSMVDLATEYLDAANNLAWTGVGVVACNANYVCTQAIQQLGTTTAKTLRSWTGGWFEALELSWRRQGEEVINQWLSTQQRNIYLGLPVQPISQVYGEDLLKSNGLSPAQIRQLDDAALTSRNAITSIRGKHGSERTPMGLAPSNGGSKELGHDRGGVDLGAGTPEISGTDLSELRTRVLRRGGSDGELSRELP